MLSSKYALKQTLWLGLLYVLLFNDLMTFHFFVLNDVLYVDSECLKISLQPIGDAGHRTNVIGVLNSASRRNPLPNLDDTRITARTKTRNKRDTACANKRVQ